MSYFDALTGAMNMLAARPNTIFIGQGVAVPGTTMSATLEGIPDEKRLEMPVAEDMQMGLAIGMSLGGLLPVCIFPRWNFVLCAANQLVNHLDRLPLYSKYRPKVIIRTAVPSKHPFNPGPQHDDDFSDAFKNMLRTVKMIRLTAAYRIMLEYKKALEREESTILVEYTHAYRDERAKAAA